MSTPSGIARAHFIAEGREFIYSSMDEMLAISDFNRLREVTMISPLMAGADGEQYNKVIRGWKSSVYPELKMDNIKRLRDYREQYKAYENMKIEIIG